MAKEPKATYRVIFLRGIGGGGEMPGVTDVTVSRSCTVQGYPAFLNREARSRLCPRPPVRNDRDRSH